MAIEYPTEQELTEIHVFAVQLGKDAGKLLLEAARLRISDHGKGAQEYTEKDSAVDIVTKTDEGEPKRQTYPFVPRRLLTFLTDVEAFIKTSIVKKYPNHAYVIRWPR